MKKNKNKFNRLLIGLTAALLFATTDAYAAQTTRVSVNSAEVQATGNSGEDSISADGRYVAFSSSAGNLVDWDTNVRSDVFVRDRVNGTTTRVSVSSGGTQGNSQSNSPVISADGRYVAFTSDASNLVTGDTNRKSDVFVRDRATNQTTRISVSSGGVQGNAQSNFPVISADGRYVAFTSSASNLVVGDNNGLSDAFVRDRVSGQTTRFSVNSGGVQRSHWSQSNAISADGRYLLFTSETDDSNDFFGNATSVFIRDRVTNSTKPVSGSPTDHVWLSRGGGLSVPMGATWRFRLNGFLMTTVILPGFMTA
jgi:Tol biopolymer transport system component